MAAKGGKKTEAAAAVAYNFRMYMCNMCNAFQPNERKTIGAMLLLEQKPFFALLL